MKVTESVCLMCEITDKEKEKLEAIAKGDNTSIEKALQKAVQNFLSIGVQTPENHKLRSISLSKLSTPLF